MTKLQFLLSLHDKLAGLPRDEVEERLNFYSEMIEDRMEDGLSEEEAVAAVGSVDEIAEQITADIPLIKIVKEKVKPKRKRNAWEITLLAVGSPIWVPLLIAVVALAFLLYVSLWSIVISLWAVFASLVVCAVAGLIMGVALSVSGNVYGGLMAVAAGFVCAGLAVFLFYGCKVATKGIALLAKIIVLSVKKGLTKKEEA